MYVESQDEGGYASSVDGDWEKQRHQRRKDHRENRENTGAKNGQRRDRNAGKVLHGTATGTSMKAGPGPNRDLWVYNIHREMDDAALRLFIEEGGATRKQRVQVRVWDPRYKPHYDTKCFRLTIPKKDYEYVFNCDFWPEDISVRKYIWYNSENQRPEKKRDAEDRTSERMNAAAESIA